MGAFNRAPQDTHSKFLSILYYTKHGHTFKLTSLQSHANIYTCKLPQTDACMHVLSLYLAVWVWINA